MIPFILAQLADALTMRFAYEANPIVLALGDAAYLAKALLIVAVVGIAYTIGRTRYSWMRPTLLGIGIVVGLIGAASNVVTYF